jgi:hypothetical protein
MRATSGCCFLGCSDAGTASLVVRISPAPDGAPVGTWAHDGCLARARDASVEPDDPTDHGRIPAGARCAFCGQSLPIVGRHPLAFDVGDAEPPHRFWAHAQCLADRLTPSVRDDVFGPASHPHD